MGRLGEDLAQHQLIGIDSSVISYLLTRHTQWAPVAREAFQAIRDGGGRPSAVFSEVMVMEAQLLALLLGGERRRRRLEQYLSNYPNSRRVEVTADVSRQAALLRYGLRLKTADALIAASAMVSGADALLTNDRAWRRLPISVYLLSDYLAA